jgi:polysaccharide export outer membrane protein
MFGIAVPLMIAGCSSGLSELASIPAAPAGPQRLETGDSIRVAIRDIAGADGEYTVNGAGMISLPLIDEVEVRGLTIPEVQVKIAQAYQASGIFTNPQVNVQPAVLRPYYVLGEVNRPGEFAYRQGMTVQAAIAAAGGFTYRAKSDQVEITRTIDGKDVVGSATSLTPVTPGDRIRVLEKWF